jgi:hypothetical protein
VLVVPECQPVMDAGWHADKNALFRRLRVSNLVNTKVSVLGLRTRPRTGVSPPLRCGRTWHNSFKIIRLRSLRRAKNFQTKDLAANMSIQRT